MTPKLIAKNHLRCLGINRKVCFKRVILPARSVIYEVFFIKKSFRRAFKERVIEKHEVVSANKREKNKVRINEAVHLKDMPEAYLKLMPFSLKRTVNNIKDNPRNKPPEDISI
jgi:hypothetical protein